MSQAAFEAQHRKRWEKLEAVLQNLERGVAHEEGGELPTLLRSISHDLALARYRLYAAGLIDELNALALRGYRQLYRVEGSPRGLARGLGKFARTVREEWPWVVFSTLLFVAPALITFLWVRHDPGAVRSLMGEDSVANLEGMYDPNPDNFLKGRSSESDLTMFCFYIFNNVGISFRIFAAGIFAGVGSAFFLVLNGVVLGVASAHLLNVGFERTFFPFIVAHSAFELTAFVLSGAAGLRLGWAVIAPGRLTRRAALAAASTRVLPVVLGMTAMLFIAAFLEAFWSSLSLSPMVKYSVGAAMWLLVAALLMLPGRQRAD